MQFVCVFWLLVVFSFVCLFAFEISIYMENTNKFSVLQFLYQTMHGDGTTVKYSIRKQTYCTAVL